MIGTNDVASGDTAGEVAAGVTAVIEAAIKTIPAVTEIVLLSILPRSHQAMNNIISEANEKLSTTFADTTLLDGQITFIDLTNLFRAKDGSIKRNMYLPDRFHPSSEGLIAILKNLQVVLDQSANLDAR